MYVGLLSASFPQTELDLLILLNEARDAAKAQTIAKGGVLGRRVELYASVGQEVVASFMASTSKPVLAWRDVRWFSQTRQEDNPLQSLYHDYLMLTRGPVKVLKTLEPNPLPKQPNILRILLSETEVASSPTAVSEPVTPFLTPTDPWQHWRRRGIA